jgi:hypothetical protein
MSEQMKQYWMLCRLKDEPGAGATRVYIMARDPYSATQLLKAQYGKLLISDYAMPV